MVIIIEQVTVVFFFLAIFGLSCFMWDLFLFSFCYVGALSLVAHGVSGLVTCGLSCCKTCGILATQPGMEPHSLHCKADS